MSCSGPNSWTDGQQQHYLFVPLLSDWRTQCINTASVFILCLLRARRACRTAFLWWDRRCWELLLWVRLVWNLIRGLLCFKQVKLQTIKMYQNQLSWIRPTTHWLPNWTVKVWGHLPAALQLQLMSAYADSTDALWVWDSVAPVISWILSWLCSLYKQIT